ncbi:hypothetical protein GQ42DRAFT_170310 [Ramicandelaber brevisporus]|nr:hypothetical protein GQ42DRAFT_170310 [Ramicandelaber brevisporus]
MPPKRRRAIAAFSTAVDSLRDKNHHFVDTADEEQPREVSQLVDRLSISNHGLFRLLDLPYELLEYTAERYFTREEAAPILPVSRMFNELFANRLWRCITFDSKMANGSKAPKDVSMKNTRRIRTVKLWSTKPDFFVSGYFAYVTSITFDIKEEMEAMFTLHLEQMKCLRRVNLRIDNKSNNVIDATAKWVSDSHRSGHVQQIVIRASFYLYILQANHLLALLMEMIKFKKRIRLEYEFSQMPPASIIQCMPNILTKLFISETITMGCHGEINKLVFGTDPESVFVHLHTLRIQVCCNKSTLYTFQSFAPERFPVLRSLAMYVPKWSCNGDVDAPLAAMFSNKQWSSVTDLTLIGARSWSTAAESDAYSPQLHVPMYSRT